MDTEISTVLIFFVNGKKIKEKYVDPEWTLLQYLRNNLGLCGTKLGCGEGGCGACTVMVSKFDREKNKVIHLPVNACLTPICSLHGLAVTTVEGIGSTKTKLHPVQERIAKSHGSQCGFCTPGMVMSMYTLLRNSPKPTMQDLETTFQGNLCRCTGYRPIVEGYKTFTEEWEVLQNGNAFSNGNGVCGLGKNCCKIQNGINGNKSLTEKEEALFRPSEFVPYHPSQEPIFPPELKINEKYDKQYLFFKSKKLIWYRPTTLNALLKLKNDYPDAKIVVGNTEVGIEIKFKSLVYSKMIHLAYIPELTRINEIQKGVMVGAATTLEDLDEYLKRQIKDKPEHATRIFKSVVKILHRFGGKQIRSVGTLGGNIMTGSPISDMLPILIAAKVELELISKDQLRKVTLDSNFFIGYRKSIIRHDEILLSILIPYSKEDQYFESYKQSRRREDDMAIVNESIDVTFLPKSDVIETIHFGIGGVSFKVVSAPKTEAGLAGLQWNRNTLETALNLLLEDIELELGAPGGMVLYRKSLVLSLFLKAFLKITKLLGNKLSQRELSSMDEFGNQRFKSSHYFSIAPDRIKTDTIQKPIVHTAAYKQATGEALYCDDVPKFKDELYCAFVLSTKAYADIVNIDETEALAMEGVHGFFSSKDLDNDILWGSVFHDEEVFYTKRVTSQGQIIGLVAADTQAIAQKAANKVKVVYKELMPVILSIEDAIFHKSFFEPSNELIKGDVDEVFKKAKNIVEGECRIGGQEHFYLETQSCIVVPKSEDDEMEIYAGTQHPTEISRLVGEVLGVPQSKIICKVKRIGGGFGGKESKAAMIAIPVAVAAKKINKPLRCILNRDEDMIMTGGRHSFYNKYKVAFDDSGRILGCEIDLYSNCGYARDVSLSVMCKAMLSCDNSYIIPNCRITGRHCKTNLPSNTGFRGFGGPQGMFVMEVIIQQIADYLRKEADIIREINLYSSGNKTHYNQQLVDCNLDKCWKECLESSNFHYRKINVRHFNEQNKYKKRGICIIPTKYGVCFPSAYLNQAGALVLIYTDGSVLLSHGGVEMGQGLHTKMIQVASTVLEIPIEKIHVSETATDKVPNTSPTAASSGSDLNGMAVLDACTTLKNRLKPYKKTNSKGTWEDWVKAAYLDRVSLAASGFYKTPDIGYDWEKMEGNLFNYFTYGAACTEVEIDTLTGDHQVQRTDIVMDLGESLNPAIDVGQIEGAFLQGYGLFILEEMMYSPKGETLTKGPGTYKIPTLSDIPKEFNVSLLKGVSNPRAVYSSKAVGEPPLFLASSVFFAIRDAIKAARDENNVASDFFRLDAPLTSEKIRMACKDDIISKLEEPEPGSFKPWNIII